MAYVFSKRTLSNYIHELATHIAPQGIRANVIHPTNCNTDMLQSEPMYRSFRPDLEAPTREDATRCSTQQAMKVPWVEPGDVSNMVLFLASDESRYVTGMQMRVDAGGYLCGTTTTSRSSQMLKVNADGSRCQDTPSAPWSHPRVSNSMRSTDIPPGERRSAARVRRTGSEAVRSCPEQAISIIDE